MIKNPKIIQVLRPGDVILLDVKPKWWQLHLRFVYGAIRRYQRRKYPKSHRTEDIHACLVLETEPVRLFSFEAPKAVLKWFRIEERTKYRVCRYRPADRGELPEFQLLLREAAERLKDKRYDYGQLIDILVKQLFPWAIPKRAMIFDLGRWRKVCSVAVHWCFLYWWRNYWRRPVLKSCRMTKEEIRELPEKAWDYPRPLGVKYIETTCPADFANHKTFKIIYEDEEVED